MLQQPRSMFRHLLHAALLALAVATPALALEAGAPAPLIEARDAGGQSLQIRPEAGKVLYVDFWASWCGPCRQSFPWMNAMQAKYGAQGLQIVGINLDAETGDAAKFLARTPADFTIAYDPSGSSAERYGVMGMPTSLLIGTDGRVIQTHMGFNADSGAELEAALRRALGLAP